MIHDRSFVPAVRRSIVLGPLGETLGVCADDTADTVVVADLCPGVLDDVRLLSPLPRPPPTQQACRARGAM